MKLSEAADNNTYTISSLKCSSHSDTLRISALGFVPGCKIRLLKSSPYRICMVGSGKIAVSDNIADMIYVKQ